MQFSEETIAASLEEAKPLLLKNWYEAELDQFPLDPDFELYLRLEKEGAIKSFACREDNKMIGYVVYFVHYHPHYKTVLVAHCDIIFIDKAFRGQGLSFIRWCDEQLKLSGVKIVVHDIKINRAPRLLENMGYQFKERRMIKRF